MLSVGSAFNRDYYRMDAKYFLRVVACVRLPRRAERMFAGAIGWMNGEKGADCRDMGHSCERGTPLKATDSIQIVLDL